MSVLRVGWLSAWSLVAACQSGDGSGDAAVAGDASSVVDAALSDSGVVDVVSGRPDASTEFQGLAIVLDSSGLSYADAWFRDGPVFVTPTLSVGDCSYFDEVPPTGGYSAGTVTFSGPIPTVTIAPNGIAPNVGYTPKGPVPSDLLTAGQTITIEAAGAAVPAFSGAVTVPEATSGWTPPATISRSSDLNVTWTPAGADEMWLMVFARDPGDTRYLARAICRFGDTGAGTMDASLLALLPTADSIGLIELRRTNISVVETDGLAVELGAQQGNSDLAFFNFTP